MHKLKHIFLVIISCGWLLLLSGCNAVVLDPKGMVAADEKQLLIDAVLLMLIIVIPVIILTLVIAFKYRASNTKAKYTPDWAHSYLLEAGWWLLPIIIIIALAILTWRSTHALDPYKPLDVKGKPLTIQVISLDWKWLFIYPDQNLATVNFVEFPVNTPVTFLITSDAPMNSFMIQQLAGQIYSMAGMQTQLHMIANAIGDYSGRSVSFSGDGFAGMTFTARVVSANDFSKWVKTVKQSSKQLTNTSYDQLAKPSENNPVVYYASVPHDLFNNVIMKYMGPGMDMASMSSDKEVPSDEYKNRDYEHHKTYMSPMANDNKVKGK